MRRTQRLAAAALALAVGAVVLLVFVPVSSTERFEVTVDPVSGEEQEAIRRRSETLLEHEGSSLLFVLAVPLVLTGLGVIGARRSSPGLLAGVAVAYTVSVFVALASIGLLFLPSLVVLLLALRSRSVGR